MLFPACFDMFSWPQNIPAHRLLVSAGVASLFEVTANFSQVTRDTFWDLIGFFEVCLT